MNKLNKRELATVLHALRHTQKAIMKGTDISECLHFAPEGIKPLTVEEIDGLCERLNAGEQTRIYRITVTKTEPSRSKLTELVVRASTPSRAKKVATDVLDEMWPKGNQRFSKMSGLPVELSVDELVEPENGGRGYCYPVLRAPRIFKYTFA